MDFRPDKLRIACIGECMIELSGINLVNQNANIGFAGDTLNTAIYLTRALPEQDFSVSYFTVLGIDAFSEYMIGTWKDEGIDCSFIGRHDTRVPGIYAVELDARGERNFQYWRDNSAARCLFQNGLVSLDALSKFDVIFVSGITLAILPSHIRSALILRCKKLRRQGVWIVFDPNYRPLLWESQQAALQTLDAMWRATTVGLPSLDDHKLIYPDTLETQALTRLIQFGPDEIVIKRGEMGPLVWRDEVKVLEKVEAARKVVDTTGAGDAFNAGYLAARLQGVEPEFAAIEGHFLACKVIACMGAII